jgi:hypothetical protein
MKRIRTILVLLALVLSLATPLSAGCLNVYNNSLVTCDAAYCSNGMLTCMGCYADALAGYYGCIGRQAVS